MAQLGIGCGSVGQWLIPLYCIEGECLIARPKHNTRKQTDQSRFHHIIVNTFCFYKNCHSRHLYFRLFNAIVRINFANDWIRTADLWSQKRPLYQLSHNHFPFLKELWRLFLNKRSPKNRNFWGLFLKNVTFNWNWCGYFWANFEKLATFDSNIWSHL